MALFTFSVQPWRPGSTSRSLTTLLLALLLAACGPGAAQQPPALQTEPVPSETAVAPTLEPVTATETLAPTAPGPQRLAVWWPETLDPA